MPTHHGLRLMCTLSGIRYGTARYTGCATSFRSMFCVYLLSVLFVAEECTQTNNFAANALSLSPRCIARLLFNVCRFIHWSFHCNLLCLSLPPSASVSLTHSVSSPLSTLLLLHPPPTHHTRRHSEFADRLFT